MSKCHIVEITCRGSCIFSGTLNAEGHRSDVDKEYVLYLDSVDEGESWLLDENLNRCKVPAECKRLYQQGDEGFMVLLLDVKLIPITCSRHHFEN